MTAEAPDWRLRAACQGRGQEMVPGPDDRSDPLLTTGNRPDLQGCHAVRLAKKICASCDVLAHCLRRARQLAQAFGADYVQGIWGGLTSRERATWQVLGTPPIICSRCAQWCVPIHLNTTICSPCDPQVRPCYDDYRSLVVAMIDSGRTLPEVAERLHLNQRSLASACERWGLAGITAGKPGKRPVAECGTLAAKRRHSKKGESWENCACRTVRWRRGRKRTATASGE